MNSPLCSHTTPIFTRRDALRLMGGGFGWLAFSGLAARAASPLAPKLAHHPARAKRVIFLCMRGAPSHVDTLDYKPKLNADSGKPGPRPGTRLLGSTFKFAQHGASGQWISELFPAFRMQTELPGVMNLDRESVATKQLYGIGNPMTEDFGRKCLLARQLIEAGVRFVEVTHGNWDHHFNLNANLRSSAAAVDTPLHGLLTDLAARGLLKDTLVVWTGEFGRTPHAEGSEGRDHNVGAFSLWMAGGGVKPGISYGASDDYGYEAVENKVPIVDLHATMLHLLGLDHERLTFRHAGRDFRLTDTKGNVVREICA